MFFACDKSDNQPTNDTTPTVTEPADNIYQFKVLDGQGDSVSLSIYEGQVLLVVNTATQCGYTPQYEDLERIYETYRDQGFTILDFPCNQFGGQAPGSFEDIHGFCTGTYNISFPQFDKIEVNGSNASPLYIWLKKKKPGAIQWNFTKFLIDREGNVVRRFEPNSNMTAMENAIQAQL
ncbi:MAG: glutathione peroxidase [Bacteroidales bacterium]|nr:glutathione peroxidase [Bacteroidales bacterium]